MSRSVMQKFECWPEFTVAVPSALNSVFLSILITIHLSALLETLPRQTGHGSETAGPSRPSPASNLCGKLMGLTECILHRHGRLGGAVV